MIKFKSISVGATENIMMAASLAEGQTIINNAAKEPEIIDLGECLNSMGAKIIGHGTNTINIEGVNSLHDSSYDIMFDRPDHTTQIIKNQFLILDLKRIVKKKL